MSLYHLTRATRVYYMPDFDLGHPYTWELFMMHNAAIWESPP